MAEVIYRQKSHKLATLSARAMPQHRDLKRLQLLQRNLQHLLDLRSLMAHISMMIMASYYSFIVTFLLSLSLSLSVVFYFYFVLPIFSSFLVIFQFLYDHALKLSFSGICCDIWFIENVLCENRLFLEVTREGKQ